MKGKAEDGEAEGILSYGKAAKKRGRPPVGGRRDLLKFIAF